MSSKVGNNLNRGHKKGGYNKVNSFVLIKEAPETLIQLRTELQLPQHADIVTACIPAKTFEESIGIIALHLDIALDGTYEAVPLFTMLINALRNRFIAGMASQPHKRAAGLVRAEMHESEGEVKLTEIPEEEAGIIATPASLLVEKDKPDVAV